MLLIMLQNLQMLSKYRMNPFMWMTALLEQNSITEAIELQSELHSLFLEGGFVLRKWNSSETEVLKTIPSELKDVPAVQTLPSPADLDWHSGKDYFRLTVSKLPPLNNITKRVLISDVAKTFDILEWFSPTTIKKILLQQLWDPKVDWDNIVPHSIYSDWLQWRTELHLLSEKQTPPCNFDKCSEIVSIQLHGFCDASEKEYAGVVYIRSIDTFGNVNVSDHSLIHLLYYELVVDSNIRSCHSHRNILLFCIKNIL